MPTGMGEFARVLVGSIGTGVGDVSTVEGVGSGLVLAALLVAVVGIVAAWASPLGTDEKAPNLRQDDLIAYCRTQLTGYTRPQHIDLRDSPPKTPIGKILRRELRDEKKA